MEDAFYILKKDDRSHLNHVDSHRSQGRMLQW